MPSKKEPKAEAVLFGRSANRNWNRGVIGGDIFDIAVRKILGDARHHVVAARACRMPISLSPSGSPQRVAFIESASAETNLSATGCST